jgi:hypothetical protein
MLVAKIMTAHLKSRDRSTLELIGPPNLPQSSIIPYIAKGTIGGLAAGLLLSLVLIGVRCRHAVA